MEYTNIIRNQIIQPEVQFSIVLEMKFQKHRSIPPTFSKIQFDAKQFWSLALD